MSKFTYIVKEEDSGLAIKSILKLRFGFSSRMMTKFKQNDAVSLNGTPAKGWMTPVIGDKLEIILPDEKSEFEAENIPVTPVYEDEHLLVINKQAGYVVHPTMGQSNHTMANAIMNYMNNTGQSFKIRFVNRLDRDTSGLLIVAKNAYVQEELTKQMKKNLVRKRYVSVLCGLIDEEKGTIDAPIGRESDDRVERAVMSEEEGGYASVTHYEIIERYKHQCIQLNRCLTNGLGENGENTGFDKEDLARRYAAIDKDMFDSHMDTGKAKNCEGATLVRLTLETGRTHQIRVHTDYIGHNVAGDTLYGGEIGVFEDGKGFIPFIKRQALHAEYLEFIHPITGEKMEIQAPLPEDIAQLIEILK